MRAYVQSFVAGFVSTLVFHQGLLYLLHASGRVPFAPYNLTPVPPLGVPAVFSLAFWGGVWGIALWWLIANARGAQYWLRALAIGAIAPSAVALFLVFPLKGREFAAGWDPKIIVGALLLNGAWGIGVALFMKLMRRGV